jgi:anti-sigma factor RsiW
VIETLTDDAQILLLYLADELPEVDRQIIDRRLAMEPALADELEQLRETYGDLRQRLEQADEVSGFPVNVNAVTRSVGREMRQRLAAGVRPAATVKKPAAGKRIRPWLIPSAVAAAVVVASMLWIANTRLENKTIVQAGRPNTTATHPTAPAPDQNLELFQDSFSPPSREIADILVKDTTTQDDASPSLLKVGTVQESGRIAGAVKS